MPWHLVKPGDNFIFFMGEGAELDHKNEFCYLLVTLYS
jgi:hypothetical protein